MFGVSMIYEKKPLTFTEAEHQEINTFVIIEIILCN